MDEAIARRDDAQVALLAAIAAGDLAAVQPACSAWFRAWEDAHDARPGRIDIEHWWPDEAEQVVANLAAAFLAGPEIVALVVRYIVGLGQPEPAALSRPLTLPQLVSAAWTAAVQRWDASGGGPGWWTSEAGRTTAAALAEACCTTDPGYDLDLTRASSTTPGTGGVVSFDEALVPAEVDPPASAGGEHAELVLSFVLRGGPTTPGVTWWPGPQEYVRGWPHPLPPVADEIAAALQVPAIDVYEREAFLPAPLLPIGHGPRALPDLRALDAVAGDHGTEVVSALGTLSTDGVQVVVRTSGPTPVFASEPGMVNLVTPDAGG